MDPKDKVTKADEEWKKELTPEQYNVLREKATEAPFTGKYYLSKEDGMYRCAACGNALFSSDAKFESGSGWPSFYKPVSAESVKTIEDTSHGMIRTEILCGGCGSHLGHVFSVWPEETGMKYFCVNSCALDLEKKT